jgi:drug/metabolite transporter (DMT)-like permease
VHRSTALLFVALGVFWGIPYALIKIAVVEVEPAMLVLARTAIAALVLLPVAAARHELRPLLRHWRPLLAYTVAEIVVPWFFLNTAERRLPSSTAGLILAAIPLVSLAVGIALGRREHLSRRHWLGIALSTVGVVAIVGLNVAGSDPLSVAAMCVVVLGYAVGPAILSRWMPGAPGVGVAAASLAISAVVYAPIVGVTGAWPERLPSAGVIASVVVLAVVCSAASFIILVRLIATMGPMRVTTVTYVNPVVAVLTGVLLLNERLSPWALVGFALVLVGSILFSSRRRAAAPLETTGVRPA